MISCDLLQLSSGIIYCDLFTSTWEIDKIKNVTCLKNSKSIFYPKIDVNILEFPIENSICRKQFVVRARHKRTPNVWKSKNTQVYSVNMRVATVGAPIRFAVPSKVPLYACVFLFFTLIFHRHVNNFFNSLVQPKFCFFMPLKSALPFIYSKIDVIWVLLSSLKVVSDCYTGNVLLRSVHSSSVTVIIINNYCLFANIQIR